MLLLYSLLISGLVYFYWAVAHPFMGTSFSGSGDKLPPRTLFGRTWSLKTIFGYLLSFVSTGKHTSLGLYLYLS